MPMHANDYITLGEAAKIAPGRPSANCVWRWCRKGVLSRAGQRVRLRHVRIGGKIITKQEEGANGMPTPACGRQAWAWHPALRTCSLPIAGPAGAGTMHACRDETAPVRCPSSTGPSPG
jgi:hypothetical protein